MTAHAAASPSSAAMWMNCPASITLTKDVTRPSSRYAKEGTAAHKIAETILGGDLFPPGKIVVEGDEFVVGLPMLRALNPYIDFVQQLQNRTVDVHIEKRVKISGSGLVWGTADCVAKCGKILDVVDLKYGKGVSVDPDSPQLKIYALGAIHTLWPQSAFHTINLTVVQPRINMVPMTYALSYTDLLQWAHDDLTPAMERIQQGSTDERTGHWCRWCVRKADCKAFKAHKNSAAKEIFDDGVDTIE